MFLGSVGFAQEDSDHVREYFAALRVRGLHAVAEEYAISRLRDPNLPASERVELIGELSRTLLAHGAVTEGQEREELWTDAERRVQNALTNELEPADRLELESSQAFIPATQGDVLAFEARLSPEDLGRREQARERLRMGIDQLRAILPRLQSLTAGTPLRSAAREKERRVRERLVMALVSYAELLPSGPDRTALLVEVENEITAAFRAQPTGEMARNLKIHQARVAEQQGDLQRAMQILNAIPTQETTGRIYDEVISEKARLLRSQGATDEALELVAKRLRSGPPPSLELRSVAVNVLLDSARLAKETGNDSLQQQLLSEAQKQAEQLSGRWRQLAMVRLARFEEDVEFGPELAALVRQARASYQAGLSEQAAREFGLAAEQAFSRNLTEEAAEFAMMQGSVQVQSGQWSAAEQTFSNFLTRLPQHPRAADADLLRIYALGRREQQEMTPPALSQLPGALADHIRRYQSSPTRWEANWMLGLHSEQAGDGQNALARYAEIPRDHGRFLDAGRRRLALFPRILERDDLDPSTRLQWQSAATATAIEISGTLRESSVPDFAECQTLLLCARLLIDSPDPRFVEADELLQTVMDRVQLEAKRAELQGEPLPAEWKQLEQATLQSRIISLVGQEKLETARKLISELRRSSPDAVLDVLNGLTEFSSSFNNDRRYQLGVLLRGSVEELTSRGNLTPEQERKAGECAAAAALAMGDVEEAIRRLEGILRNNPRDVDLMKRVVELSLRKGGASQLNRGLRWATQRESLQRAGSPEWIQARLDVVEIQTRLGSKDDARKLLGVARTLYPQMGSPELKARSDELWNELTRSR